jgi:adenylyl- and sulfurtransferase ThiI
MNEVNGVKAELFGGRIFPKCSDFDYACRVLPYVFGISYFAPCIHVKLKELDDFIRSNVENLLGGVESFAVRARREGKHEFTSLDLEKRIGKLLLKHLDAELILKT